jgi:hypothetical protein
MPGREPAQHTLAMLIDTLKKVGRNTDIQRAVEAARHNVDYGLAIHPSA